MNNFIVEALLREAEKRVGQLVRKGVIRETAISRVSHNMHLTEDEVETLTKTVDAKTPAEMPSPSDLAPTDNVINFASGNDVEQASGMLMYKGIPWRIKSVSPAFLSFDNSTILTEAKEALKRRWDFLENENRVVASIEFDNLDEYQKVLDFIQRSKFMVSPGSSETLSEDILDELASTAKKTKTGKVAKIKESDIAPRGHAYQAVSKGYSHVSEENFDPTVKECRAIKVRKKWK